MAISKRGRRVRRWSGIAIVVLFGGCLAIPRGLPVVLESYRSDIVFRGPQGTSPRTVYITIDDAPSPRTNEILAVLQRHNVPATFFLIADRIDDPEQVRGMLSAGHAIGHHMKTTRAAARLSLEEFRSDFDAAERVFAPFGTMDLFRMPSDFGTREQSAYAQSKGYTVVAGTAFPLDHWLTSPTWIRHLAGWLTVDRAIIILHDGIDRGARTAVVLDQLIPELKARGFTIGDLAGALRTPAD